MDLISANIQNPTSLWRYAGTVCGYVYETEEYVVSSIPKSDWPNKFWLKQLNTSFEKPVFPKSLFNEEITFVQWELNGQKKVNIPDGLEIKNELKGMSIDLDDLDFNDYQVKIERVRDEYFALLWSRLFQKAFGYRILPSTIIKTMNDISYYVAHFQDQPVGTVVLYQQDHDVAGIHSMGIPPEFRRKGFAESILKQILDLARRQGAKHAVLQASDMGKGLYLKTGFREDFRLINFINQELEK